MQRATFSLVVTHFAMRSVHGLGNVARCLTIKILLVSRMITAGRRKLFDLHTTEQFLRAPTLRTRFKNCRRRLFAEISIVCYAVPETGERVGRNGLRDADLIRAVGWTSLSESKSATTNLPAVSQAYPEATEENSCSYVVSVCLRYRLARIALSGHDCQHSTYIASPTKAFPRTGMSLAFLPHQEIEVILWQDRSVDFGYQAFLSRVASEALRSCKSTEKGGENK